MPGIDASGPTPPYRQIAEDIRRRIEQGELAAGERVPSSRELMGEYGVASMTVHQAIKVLRDEGVVVSYPGRGVYVRQAEEQPNDEVPAEGPLDSVRTELAELKARVHSQMEGPSAAAFEAQLAELRQQVGRIEANLIDLYGKVGQQYPHAGRSGASRRAEPDIRRQASGA